MILRHRTGCLRGRWGTSSRLCMWALGGLIALTGSNALAQSDGSDEVEALEDLSEPEEASPASERQDLESLVDSILESYEPEERPSDEGSRRSGRRGSPQDSPASRMSSADYLLRLQELEDRVNDLKEQIFRSKSRLVLLRERVLGTQIGGSQAVLTHVNDMSAAFTLDQVIYSLDGNQLYNATNSDGELDDRDEIELYNGTILPGPHNVAVEMIFVGNGYGIFSYLEGYRIRVQSSESFIAEDGKVAYLQIVAFEEGGINQPIEERPAIRFELEFLDSVVAEE